MKVVLDMYGDIVHTIAYANLIESFNRADAEVNRLVHKEEFDGELTLVQKEDLKQITKVREALLTVLDYYTVGGDFLTYSKTKQFKKEFKKVKYREIL